MIKITNFKVDNEELYNELYKYIETLKHNPEQRMNDKLGMMIYTIVSGLASRSNFIGYSYKDEMISLGVFYSCKYIKNYDLKRKNPHAYISKIAENSFRSVINDEKKKMYVKCKTQLNNDSTMNVENLGNHEILKGTVGDFQGIEQFVQDYEDAIEAKKQKKNLKHENMSID
jgi:hypothetical protein